MRNGSLLSTPMKLFSFENLRIVSQVQSISAICKSRRANFDDIGVINFSCVTRQ